MLEVNAIYFILLVEGFVLLLILLLVWALLTLIGKRRKKRHIAELEARFKSRKQLRGEQSRTFLQAVFNFEGEDLGAALENIDHHESELLQHLIGSLKRGGRAQLNKLDASLDSMIECYKCLQPRQAASDQEEPETLQELAALRGENDSLRNELSVAENKLRDTIAEFGDMFGGGRDHQLAFHEIIEKIDAMKAANSADEPGKIQK